MAYKKLIKVSNVCQLLDKSKYPATTTKEGITWTNNGDGTVTANGTCTAEYYVAYVLEYNLKDKTVIGHKYALFAGNSLVTHYPAEVILMFSPRSDGKYFSAANVEHVDGKVGWVLTEGSYSRYSKVELRIRSGATVENFIFKPQLFDLTEMYGAGHEPTTVEQFRQDFPEEMYDYSPRCWLTSYKRNLKVSNVCQLLDKSKYPATTTKNGITFTNNGDGSITINGTATNHATFYLFSSTTSLMGMKVGSTYMISMEGSTSSYHLYSNYYSYGSWHGAYFNSYESNNKIKTIPSTWEGFQCYILVFKGATLNNITLKPQLFDLTEMYGAGHEPTTVEQFRADFPNELYDYKPYSIIPSYQRNLTCKTKNLFDISKYAGCYSSNSTYELSNNSIKLNITGKDAYVGQQTDAKISFEVEPNTTYYFSCDYANTNNTISKIIIGTFNSEKVWTNNIFMFSNGLLKGSFTTNDSTYYLSFRFGSNSVENEISTSIFSNIMVVKGDTATDYVPYGHL